MRIAVLEAVCAGMCGDDPSPSLLAEGLAMWRAVVDDLLAIPDITVATLINARCQHHAPPVPRFDCLHVENSLAAQQAWNECLSHTDAAWIIAPESDHLLERFVSAVPPTIQSWNAHPSAVRMCADKAALAQHLLQHSIRTIPTDPVDWELPPSFANGPSLVKPRDGAGSQLVRRISNQAEWRAARIEYLASGHLSNAIRQPYIPGRALSIAGWFHPRGVTWFPVAEQHLSTDGCFTYQGGTIPADIDAVAQAAVQKLATDVAATIPGLCGYIGMDVLLPKASPAHPVLVEINPRMTTSSIGIRRLCTENWLASLLTEPTRSLRWHTDRRIHFTATGDVHEERLP